MAPLGFSERVREFGSVVGRMDVCDSLGEIVLIDVAFSDLCQRLRDLRNRRGKALFVGNGGSCAVAMHMSMDFSNRFCAAISISDAPTLTGASNDHGFENVYARVVRQLGAPEDMLFALSSSGRSENILRACREATQVGMHVTTLSGMADDNPLRSLGHLNIHVPSERYAVVEVMHHMFCHLLLDAVA